jgi:hypothetical protein
MFDKVNFKICLLEAAKGALTAIAGAAVAITAITVAFPISTDLKTNEITLTFETQDFKVTGEFVGFQQNAYIVITEMGELYIPASFVTCEGFSCLKFSVHANASKLPELRSLSALEQQLDSEWL